MKSETTRPPWPAPSLALVPCPECGEAAEIEWRATVESTHGPVEHCKTRCIGRHWFLLPTEQLPAVSDVADATSDGE